MEWLNFLGAAVTAIMGGIGLLTPSAAAALVGLEARTPPGRSEFRATYGGLFLCLGVAPLITGAPLLFAAAGLAWLGAALGRVLSIVADRTSTAKNWAAAGFETVVGLMLIVGGPLAGLAGLYL